MQTGTLTDETPADRGLAILDPQAKSAYRRRLEEVRGELEEAEAFNDTGRATAAREEMEAISEQLAAAVGLGGRDRQTGSAAERARTAVTQRVRAAIKRIAAQQPARSPRRSRGDRRFLHVPSRPDAPYRVGSRLTPSTARR
jgi:non-specific serine/threonine protein kinase